MEGWDEERPALIPLEPEQVKLEDGSPAIVLRDPAGVVDGYAVLTPAAFWIASHFDGRRSVADVARAATAAGLPVEADRIVALARELASTGFVHGAAHRTLRERALAAYRAAGARAPSCAGSVYPDEPRALARELDGWLSHPDGPGLRSSPPGPVRLLVSPHIDYRRGGPGYAHAYRALAATDAEVFVVFGTAHASPPHLFSLTRLDSATPLGPVSTDRAVVDALAERLGEDELLADELCHRDEHSVELQLVWLKHVVRRPFTVVPVLCSSISHLADPAAATAPFLDALSRVLAGRRVCWVAGADLSHVGPMYGDARAPTASELAGLAAEDRRTLAFVARGDAGGFHRDAVRDDARRRLCGTAPIYAAMRASGTAAAVLHYAQWTDGTDSVSYAAAAGCGR